MALWTFYRVPKHISRSNSKFQSQLPTADPTSVRGGAPHLTPSHGAPKNLKNDHFLCSKNIPTKFQVDISSSTDEHGLGEWKNLVNGNKFGILQEFQVDISNGVATIVDMFPDFFTFSFLAVFFGSEVPSGT
eukprot:sb/3474955/